MKSLIHRLYHQNKIDCPPWMPDNLCYLTLMGSRAYGIETKDSDWDYYGFCMIPKKNIFPHEYGLLVGFDQIPKFDQWKKDHFIEQDSGKDMEITIYGIVRYAELLAGGNPNIIESLYTRREHVLYSTNIGERFRENRHLFLSKQNFLKTRSYAFSQLKKLNRIPEGKRKESWDTHGYDVKFAAHTIRLIDNAEQILEGELDLQRNKELVKSVRAGDLSLEEIKKYAHQKELDLEKAFANSKLPKKPDMDKIRTLLLDCISSHYQGLKVVNPNKEKEILERIKELVNKV